MSRRTYEVTVGNIGNGYYGHNKKDALREFAAWVRLIKNAAGHCSAEPPVTLWAGGEPIKEWLPVTDLQNIGTWTLDSPYACKVIVERLAAFLLLEDGELRSPDSPVDGADLVEELFDAFEQYGLTKYLKEKTWKH